MLAAVCTAVTCASVGHAPAAASHALPVESMGSGTVARYVQYTKADSLKVVGLLESARGLSGRDLGGEQAREACRKPAAA